MKLWVASLFIFPLVGQVSVEYTPMPLSVLNSLHFKTLGPWNARLCNDGMTTVYIAPERIYMAAPAIAWVDANLALNMLTIKQAQSWQSRAAEVAEIGFDLAGIFGGTGTLFNVSRKGLAKLAAAAVVAHYAQGKLQAAVPRITPFTATLLTNTVVLDPGGCTTVTMYAGKMHSPRPFAARIDLPEGQ